MNSIRAIYLAAGVLVLGGCTSAFTSTWKAPDAQPFQMAGQKVAAVVMMTSEATRRAGETTLAMEITKHGAQGVPMYQIFPDAQPASEPQARQALERAGMIGVVVMRPVSVDKEIRSVPSPYAGGPYGGYWGGYYGYGWGAAYAPDIRTDTIVTIETLIYSFRQNKLVWSAQSRETNPREVEKVIRSLATDVAKELQKEGLLSAGPST